MIHDIMRENWKHTMELDITVLRPGHIPLYSLITAKTRQKVVSHEADNVVRVDVEFKMSYSQFIDVAGRGGEIGTASDAAKSFELLKILAHKQPRAAHVVKMCNTSDWPTRQHSTQSVGNMPPPSPPHLLPQVLQIMPRNPKYDQFQPKGHHNEENPQSTTKMPGNPKFYPFH